MTAVETYELAPGYSISRVIRGGWQLAGGHGPIDRDRALEDLMAAFDAGVVTFDGADIYTGVEELYGALRARILATRGAEAAKKLRVHTKLVPDLSILRTIQRRDIEAIVDRSLCRLRMDRLDLVQFHWWDYSEPRWLEALAWLDDQRARGKLRLVGATNFDAPHARAILEAGIPLASMQVQYSVLDRRPENGLSTLCTTHGVGLICYGSIAGGFVSDRWLGEPEPSGALANRSLVKYKLIIDDFGGWRLFQDLLRALRRVAGRHSSDIASVASRFTLDLRGVAAVIVGATSRAHLGANVRIGALKLTDADRAEIEAVAAKRRGPTGDVYELERDRNGRHGSIMKYNLNAEPVLSRAP
jgi:aryl-alcohol dehydrogenase-like predicted oxidoreductase